VTDALAILRALARIWDELEGLCGNDWPRIQTELSSALWRLDAVVAPTDSDLSDVLAILGSVPGMNERFIAALADELPDVVVRGTAPVSTRIRPRLFEVVPILFATDRDPTDGDPTWFGALRGDLVVGIAEISIPLRHEPGKLESPRWWRLEFKERPERHVVLLGLEILPRTELLTRLKTQFRAQAETREGMLFIHGYNVPFVDAARRTAQIAHDLSFSGVPILYSWPSEGSLPSYMIDAGNARWTEPHFREFMQCVLCDMELSVVHVIAHSMGNIVLTEFLRGLRRQPFVGQAARIRQIIFAAPDIDAATFAQLAAEFHGHAERYTLYASSRDKALAASQRVQRYARAGDAGDGLVLVAGIDTVDASGVDTSFLGHSYIADNATILDDVADLLRHGRSPAERQCLTPTDTPRGRYWVLSATASPG